MQVEAIKHQGGPGLGEDAGKRSTEIVGERNDMNYKRVQRCIRALEAEEPELPDRVMSYIERNYRNALSLNDVAKAFFVSSSTVSHLFKQRIGVSFYRYVTQRRLIAGKSLIEKGVPMEAVAAQVGFPAYSGFYRVFKREFGISPRQYRELCRETAE